MWCKRADWLNEFKNHETPFSYVIGDANGAHYKLFFVSYAISIFFSEKNEHKEHSFVFAVCPSFTEGMKFGDTHQFIWYYKRWKALHLNETKRNYNKRLKVRNVNFTWNIHFKVITFHFMRLDSLYTRALIIHIDKNLYLCQRIMFHLGMFAKR